MPSEAITRAEGVYKSRLGILPPEAAMPSEEQLAALQFVLLNDMTPYVDFALWGPFNRRFIRRKTSLVSFTPDVTDGTWKASHKLTGPASFEIWQTDWEVFRTAMIMLEGAEPERLDQYAKFIRSLHEKHTSRCWWLIYQADIRLRSERLSRLERSSSSVDPVPTDAKYRWSNAFTKALDMEAPGMAEFWNEEVHRPAGEFKAGYSSYQDLAKDGTLQWLQPTQGPAKRQRGKGLGAGGDHWHAHQWATQPWSHPQPAVQPHWEQAQPAWNKWPALPTQSKDGGKKGGKGKGKGKGKKGKWGKDKGDGKGKVKDAPVAAPLATAPSLATAVPG